MTAALSFASVDMDVQRAGDLTVPDFTQQAHNVTTQVPFATYDQVQWVGAGNPTLTVVAKVDDGTDMASLFAALAAGTVGTLSYLGDSYSDVHIDAIPSVKRYDPGSTSIRWATIVFVQVVEP